MGNGILLHVQLHRIIADADLWSNSGALGQYRLLADSQERSRVKRPQLCHVGRRGNTNRRQSSGAARQWRPRTRIIARLQWARGYVRDDAFIVGFGVHPGHDFYQLQRNVFVCYGTNNG